MDALYFNTQNTESLLQELGVPDDFNGIYESPNGWVIVWLGKLPKKVEHRTDDEGMDYEVVTEWQTGEFFNIYLNGQKNMDFFTRDLGGAELLREPLTPNHRLYDYGGDSN